MAEIKMAASDLKSMSTDEKLDFIIEKLTQHDNLLNKIEEISNKEGMSGIPSGFTKLDELTSGWQPSDLIIIAARPGMGKTAFVMSMAKNIAIGFDQCAGSQGAVTG